MKKWIVLFSVLVLSACTQSGLEEAEPVDTTLNIPVTEGNQTVTSGIGIDNNYYQTVIPYELSPSRGLTSTNMVSTYNIEQFESGLLELSKERFSVEDFYFREGQIFTSDIVRGFLRRSFTEEEIENMSDSEREDRGAFSNLGLNPSVEGETNPDLIAQNSPLYLSHILEQNYMVEDAEGNYQLQGVTIGLAMNSEHLYRREEYGNVLVEPIDENATIEHARIVINEMLERLRANEEYQDLNILFAVYIQSGRYDIVPGKFVMTAFSPSGEAEVEDFVSINEQYELLPSTGETIVSDAINAEYRNFNNQLNAYFDNFSTTMGLARFENNDFESLRVEIPIEYTSLGEVIALTQHVKDLLTGKFDGVAVEVEIKSANATYALVVKDHDNNVNYYVYE